MEEVGRCAAMPNEFSLIFYFEFGDRVGQFAAMASRSVFRFKKHFYNLCLRWAREGRLNHLKSFCSTIAAYEYA